MVRKILYSSSLYSNTNDSGMLVSAGGVEKCTALLKLLQCFRRGLVKPALSSVMTEQSFRPIFLVSTSSIFSSGITGHTFYIMSLVVGFISFFAGAC